MNTDLDKLKKISREIIDPETELKDLIPQAAALRDLLESRTHFRVDPARDIAAGETRLDSGLAISPALAAMCLRELFRTPAFIRGLHQAISDALRPGRPVRVLYAGCGPYALLALPLMAVFSQEQVKFTLLEINPESLGKALALIASFGFTPYLDEALCADATRYTIPANKQADVIVSETMAVCLHNEPQVAIARHLLGQAPEARMVPQSVSVEMCILDDTKEHVLMPAGHVGAIPEPQRDRMHLGKIFELDAANIRSWKGIEGDRLPAGRVKIPSPLEKRHRPYLLTQIVVYGNNRLQDYDCSLTVPQRLPGKPTFAGSETLQFHYKLGCYPKLAYEAMA
ncbi:MAG: hypothetical protein K8F27_07225 [Sulfuricellaceae bacterium]|nr:hypothetical protein [Sulfuricellaceae bacterium]